MKVYLRVLCLLLSLAFTATAATNEWQALNFSNANTDSDISANTNWSENVVPGAGDTALFNLKGIGSTGVRGDLYITTNDTTFTPDGLILNSNRNPDSWRQTSDLYLDKDLTLSGDFIVTGYPGSSGRAQYRFRLGTLVKGVTLNIGGNLDISDPFSAGQSPDWQYFRLGIGDDDPGNSPVINMTGSSIVFGTPDNNTASFITTTAAVTTENATNDKGPQLRFTGVGATIDLKHAAKRTTGTIGLGDVHLDVRSDQTWTADETAFVRMYGSIGASGLPGKYVVESIDGGRLDNLGELNIRIDGNQSSSASHTTAMRLKGGTYGSLLMTGRGTSGRTHAIRQTGDVTFKRGAVTFDGDGNAVTTNFSLWISQSGSDSQQFYTDGHDLTVDKGLLLDDPAGATSSGSSLRNALLIATGSTVVVTGDVLMASPDRGPEAPIGGTLTTRNVGIDGGTDGVDLTVGGSWDVRTFSSSRDNLSSSTLTMIGGDPQGSAVTFEVGDDTNQASVAGSSWSIDALSIGDGTSNAHVRLENDYLNDNPLVASNAVIDRVGEKLVVNTLNVKAGSVLDANAKQVDVHTALDIAETARLDLSTGMTLAKDDEVTAFAGIGDQTATWSGFQLRVMDSSNDGFVFTPVYNGGDDKTYWSAIPPPSGTLILVK